MKKGSTQSTETPAPMASANQHRGLRHRPWLIDRNSAA